MQNVIETERYYWTPKISQSALWMCHRNDLWKLEADLMRNIWSRSMMELNFDKSVISTYFIEMQILGNLDLFTNFFYCVL